MVSMVSLPKPTPQLALTPPSDEQADVFAAPDVHEVVIHGEKLKPSIRVADLGVENWKFDKEHERK